MNRRRFLQGGMVALCAAPLAAEAQQAGKVRRIGHLRAAGSTSGSDALWQRLRELGYIEGQNFLIEYRNADGRPERLPALAAELVQLQVDLIVTIGTQAALAAKQATPVIPIILATSGDAVGTGLVQSLARPGGNITGMTSSAVETSGKRLQLLKEMFPKKSRLAVLWNPANPLDVLDYQATASAAQTLRATLQSVEARTAPEIEAGFAVAARARADLLIVCPDPVFETARRGIVDLAAKYRLPAIYLFREYVEAGGLMSYGPSLADELRRAAMYVDKILKGARPSDLPVEQVAKFELIVNLKTAKALGLTIPQSLLLRADQVIE